MKVLWITKPFFIEPLGIMYLSSAIKRSGHESKIITSSENIEEKISSFNPDLLAYSIMTGDQGFYDNMNKKIKEKKNILSIAGGPHPTFFPEFLENSSFDAICRGEGEEAIANFLKNPNSKDTPNFWIKEKYAVHKNAVSDLISDLDSIAFPDRELVFKYPQIKNGKIKHFIASRGCPFSCSYCFNETYSKIYQGKGKRVRFRSVDNLLSEVKSVVGSSPTEFVYFQDDTFTLNSSWLKELSEKYPKEVNLPFHCHVRPNTITSEKISLLKKAGCYSVHIAAETADDTLRNQVLKRGMSKEQITSACSMLKENNIKFMLQNIIGLPGGDIEKDLETLALNIECKPDYAWVSIFQPYPGTTLGEHCKEKNFYSGDFSDLGNNFFEKSSLNFSENYKNQISNLQKLFAFFVEYPALHYSGLSRKMIDVPEQKVKEDYLKIYKDLRKKGDKRLYGFDLD